MSINIMTESYPVDLSVTEQPIKLTISNLMYQVIGVSSVNAKIGNVVLTADDVGADAIGAAAAVREELLPRIDGIEVQIPDLATKQYVEAGLATKAEQASLDSTNATVAAQGDTLLTKADAAYVDAGLASKSSNAELDDVRTLAETNQLNVSTKAEQADLDAANATVAEHTQTLLTKADIAALTALSQLVDTKADQAYVIDEIARITGNAPASLDTLAEIAAELGNDQTQIDNLLTQIGTRVRFDAAQALTATQQDQARANINAEKAGEAAALVAGVTPGSIGAATAAQGAKADTALQSGDVAPVALSGLFNSLSNQNKIYNVVYDLYAIGANAALTATDTLGQMLGKLQAQVNAKEPAIAVGTTAQYRRGDKTWSDFATDVRNSVLTGLSTATATAINAGDTVLAALGKAQAQINSNLADINSIILTGMDLISNGLGQLRSNRFWTAYIYDILDRPTGTVGSFDMVGKTTGLGDEFIAIDPGRRYLLSYQIKQKTAGITSYCYGYISPHDIDKLPIQPHHYMSQANTLTKLAVALNPGDTTVTLESAANWNNAAGASTHLRSMIIWNYTDGTGYKWPANTYSRNVFLNLYDDGGITGNVITLRSAWTGATIPAGTEVSNGTSGQAYMYLGARNAVVTETWTRYFGIVGGVHPSGINSAASSSFPMMTAYVKVGFVGNTNSGWTGSIASSKFSAGAISFKDLGYPMPAQSDSSATDVTTLKNDFNALLAKLKANGLML